MHTIMYIRFNSSYFNKMWVVMDSNHRRQEPADLQSAPFGHSGNHPLNYFVNIKPYRPSDF